MNDDTCMDSRLIADRHPVLGRLYRVWLARADGAAMPLAEAITQRLADLEDVIVVILRPIGPDATPQIVRSGKMVDQLYGIALAGETISRLTPSSEDAENEAAIVFESGANDGRSCATSTRPYTHSEALSAVCRCCRSRERDHSRNHQGFLKSIKAGLRKRR
ncbi:hypothetical protein [Chelativorans xinjiangense]|uniref:hypothetical protein n=1 Tax=Chelativorans xinjiangense TaxID=2681485 RepID=UPI00135C9DAD|nr:hypothetical protein [Chelativorans xinjiangense]